MKYKFNWPCGFCENYVLIWLMGLQYERLWLKGHY